MKTNRHPPFQGDQNFNVFERILALDYAIPESVDYLAAVRFFILFSIIFLK